MRFVFRLFVLITGLFLVLQEMALAGIVASVHDLRGRVAFGSPQEVCKVCHIPHRSLTGSHLTPSGRYTASSITVHSGSMATPGNSSAVCLSCHDGTLAPSVGTSTTDYSNSHPFLITYSAAAGFTPPVTGHVTSAYGSLPLEGTAANKVECGTCHNPHESGTSGKFLRIENTNSNLCLTCHQK